MPQPIQGPTLADVATSIARNEKELKNSFKKKGKISKAGQAKLDKMRKGANMTGATQRERGRQRAIFKEMRRTGKGAPSTKRYNSLFKESNKIASRARKRMNEKAAVVAKKAAKAKDARKKAAKKAKAAQNKVKKAAKAKPAKKVAKKVAKARPVKKAAKRAR